MLSSLV